MGVGGTPRKSLILKHLHKLLSSKSHANRAEKKFKKNQKTSCTFPSFHYTKTRKMKDMKAKVKTTEARDIVKENAELYRKTELARVENENLTHWLANHEKKPLTK